MQILRARPMATATLTAIASAIIAFFLPANGKILLLTLFSAFLLVFALICVLSAKSRGQNAFSSVLITSILAIVTVSLTLFSSLYHFHLKTNIPDTIIDDNTVHEAECLIIEENGAGVGYSYFTVLLKTLDGQKVHGKALLECSYTATYHVGDVLKSNVQIQSIESHYDADNLYYAISDGIVVALTHEANDDIQKIGYDAMPLRRAFAYARDQLAARLISLVGKQSGGLASALFLGERDLLDQRISTDFRRTGVSHLLALSGMHVTLLMGMMTTLTQRIGIPKRGRLILLSVLLMIYLALIGFRISAVRASGMLLLFYIAEMLGRRHDSLTTLCMIGWGMLTVMPSAVADGGFWMSFSAVFGLVTVLPKFNEWLTFSKIPSKFHTAIQGMAASLTAVISVSFCTWLFCGEIAPIGILLTVVLTPILTVILVLIPPLLFLDILPFFSAAPFSPFLSFPLRCMILLTSQMSKLRNVSFTLQRPYIGAGLALMSVVLFVLLIIPLRRKILVVVPPILGAVLIVASTLIWNRVEYDDHLVLNYITRSSGSVLTVTDQEGTAIIDTSSGNYSILRDAQQVLYDQGMTEIEHLILTHYHRAHVYSTERLAKRCPIRYLWVPTPETDTDYHCLAALYERLTPCGTEIRCYQTGESIVLFQDAVFFVSDISYINRSSQPIVTYLLQTPSEVLTFSSPAVQESLYYPTFRWISDQTDILILSEHGPKIKQPLSLNVGNSLPAYVVADREEILLLPDATKCLIPTGTNIKYRTFKISK